MKRSSVLVFILSILAIVTFSSTSQAAQGGAVITGTVSDSATGERLDGIRITVAGKRFSVYSRNGGAFVIKGIPAGTYTLEVRGLGWLAEDRSGVVATEGDTTNVNIVVRSDAKNTGEIVVYGAARQAQKLTEAPAAISVITPLQIELAGSHGQIAKTMEHLPGVDVVWSGANDFNVNTRGFNNSINRRTLVLIDGRDPSTPLINLNEWNSFSSVLGDVQQIEVVRGPGSALYGQNAYNGVINVTTTNPRDVIGTRVSLTAGEWNLYRASVRHAGAIDEHWAYKISIGADYQYNYSFNSRFKDTTKPLNGLEYAGLQADVRRIDTMGSNILHPFGYSGTARVDYNIDAVKRFVLEGGYTYSGNEFYVNQTGRLVVQDIRKPFVRLAYNSERINVQAVWSNRFAPKPQLVFNALANSGEQSNVYSVDAQWNDKFFDDKLRVVAGVIQELQLVNTTYDPAISPLIKPDDLSNNFTGIYGQGEYSITPALRLVGALRVDRSTMFNTQLSPKAALVWEIEKGHSLRATFNRAFLRPSYADLYRRSPAGPPANLAGVNRTVDSVVSAVAGTPTSANLNLTAATGRWNTGNYTLTPETALSYELGYTGQILKNLFVTANAYWNQRANLIASPLGGIAQNIYPTLKSNTGDANLDRIGDSVMMAELAKINPNYPSQITTYEGKSALVIAPTNIAIVNEYGAELSVDYFLTNEFKVWANYAYISVDVKENAVTAQKILPNTSPHRVNVGLEYIKPNSWDANVSLRYVEGFRWIAGLFDGYVPAYAVLNISAGVYVTDAIRVSGNVFNALDRAHYEIFGGNILRRQASLTATVNF